MENIGLFAITLFKIAMAGIAILVGLLLVWIVCRQLILARANSPIARIAGFTGRLAVNAGTILGMVAGLYFGIQWVINFFANSAGIIYPNKELVRLLTVAFTGLVVMVGIKSFILKPLIEWMIVTVKANHALVVINPLFKPFGNRWARVIIGGESLHQVVWFSSFANSEKDGGQINLANQVMTWNANGETGFPTKSQILPDGTPDPASNLYPVGVVVTWRVPRESEEAIRNFALQAGGKLPEDWLRGLLGSFFRETLILCNDADEASAKNWSAEFLMWCTLDPVRVAEIKKWGIEFVGLRVSDLNPAEVVIEATEIAMATGEYARAVNAAYKSLFHKEPAEDLELLDDPREFRERLEMARGIVKDQVLRNRLQVDINESGGSRRGRRSGRGRRTI